MTQLITIELKDLRFFGRHGLYKEEQKIGGEFIVDLSISYETSSDIIYSIEETINYAVVFSILKKEMNEPKALLETFVMQLSAVLKERFPSIKKTAITVTKVHPPIVQFTGSVCVRFTKEF